MACPFPACYFDPEALDPRNRGDGISAMLRVRDGAEFLRPGLASCIDVFDEIVAVHHQCSDDTPQILHEYAAARPERFKVYEYPHEVFPAGTREHARQGPESPHTIAALCNYALSKTTRRYVIKHDADHVYFPRFAEIAERVRSGRYGDGVVCTAGVNLARSRAGELGVYRAYPVCGGGDFLFFPVSPDAYFFHTASCENLWFPRRPFVYAGYSFWHLKLLQRDCGLPRYQNYELDSLGSYFKSLSGADLAPGNRDSWRRAIAAFEDTIEVVSLEQLVTLFGGRNSPFIRDPSARVLLRQGGWKKVLWNHVEPWARPLAGHLILRAAGPYCKLPNVIFFNVFRPYLQARALARDLRGLSLPTASDLAA